MARKRQSRNLEPKYLKCVLNFVPPGDPAPREPCAEAAGDPGGDGEEEGGGGGGEGQGAQAQGQAGRRGRQEALAGRILRRREGGGRGGERRQVREIALSFSEVA